MARGQGLALKLGARDTGQTPAASSTHVNRKLLATHRAHRVSKLAV